MLFNLNVSSRTVSDFLLAEIKLNVFYSDRLNFPSCELFLSSSGTHKSSRALTQYINIPTPFSEIAHTVVWLNMPRVYLMLCGLLHIVKYRYLTASQL